jgi:hypothetical protein
MSKVLKHVHSHCKIVKMLPTGLLATISKENCLFSAEVVIDQPPLKTREIHLTTAWPKTTLQHGTWRGYRLKARTLSHAMSVITVILPPSSLTIVAAHPSATSVQPT